MSTPHHEEKLKYQFRYPDIEWDQLSPQVFVDNRVTRYGVDHEAILGRVQEVLRFHGLEPTRVEVVPYNWLLDGNFAAVAVACKMLKGARYFVYSLKDREEPVPVRVRIKKIPVPFEGLVPF